MTLYTHYGAASASRHCICETDLAGVVLKHVFGFLCCVVWLLAVPTVLRVASMRGQVTQAWHFGFDKHRLARIMRLVYVSARLTAVETAVDTLCMW